MRALRERSTPMRSTMSSVSRIPAVSTSLRGTPFDIDVFLDDVSGRPFDIGHDSFFLAQEVVEKARFTDVWSPDDSSRDSFAEDLSTASCLEEVGQEGFEFSGLFSDDLGCCFLYIIVLRIVDVDFDLS